MKGVVFNMLEEVVTRHHGEAAWDDLLDAAEVSGAYTSLGSYPDEEMMRLVQAASVALAIPPNEVLRWFGREAMAKLAVLYPVFFTEHKSARPFIRSVNGIIHPEVRKLYDGANCPDFDFEDAPEGTLLLRYASPRRLCGLAHGFIEGAADYYGEHVEVVQPRCMLNGDGDCLLHITWA